MFELDPVAVVDEAMRISGRAALEVLDAIPTIEASERWVDDGARNVAHWLAMRCQIAEWKANRWVTAAYALQGLPALRNALGEDVLDLERQRSVTWWYSEDSRRFEMQADLPAADGAVVAKALDRLASQIPAMPGEDDAYFQDKRHADALVAMASAAITSDPDPDRATIVVHASERTGFELEDGIPVH